LTGAALADVSRPRAAHRRTDPSG